MARCRTAPSAHVALLAALEELLHPPQIVILRGEAEQIEAWRSQLVRLYAPRRMVLAVPTEMQDLPEALAQKPAPGRGRGLCLCG